MADDLTADWGLTISVVKLDEVASEQEGAVQCSQYING